MKDEGYASMKDAIESIDPRDVDEALDEATMASDERKDESLPEAPAVSNIKVWIKGYGVMLTVRGEKMLDIVKKTETIIDYAESHHWKNTWTTIPVGTTVLPQPKSPETPTCGIHGTPMIWKTGVSKVSQKPYAFWACPTKNADGSFCSYRPKEI